MARAPFRVLILPYCKTSSGSLEYAIFRRSDTGYWQSIAEGGENSESPLEAAKRETHEEADVQLA